MRILHEIAIFQTVKSNVIISLFETVRLSVSISLRNLYNSRNSIKEMGILYYIKQKNCERENDCTYNSTYVNLRVMHSLFK